MLLIQGKKLNLIKSGYGLSYNNLSVTLLTYGSLLCLHILQKFHTHWLVFSTQSFTETWILQLDPVYFYFCK